MKYLKEIEDAVLQIKFKYEGTYIINDDYDIEDESGYLQYPIGFYALYLKSKNKIIIFNYKEYEQYEYEPKFLCEFDVNSEKEDSEEILIDKLKEIGNDKKIYPSKYDYDKIEFCENENENNVLIDDIYFADIINHDEIDHRIVQFLEE